MTRNLVGSIGVTRRSKIAKIVPILNPSWLPFRVCSNDHAQLTGMPYIFFFKIKNCLNDDLFISCDDRIGKMLHNICISAVAMSLRWATRGAWASCNERCRVSYVTGASNWYWLTVGQGLLSLQQVRVDGECFYFSTFIPVPLSPLPHSVIPSTISSVSLLPFSGRRHKMTHKGCRVVTPTQSQSNGFLVITLSVAVYNQDFFYFQALSPLYAHMMQQGAQLAVRQATQARPHKD